MVHLPSISHQAAEKFVVAVSPVAILRTEIGRSCHSHGMRHACGRCPGKVHYLVEGSADPVTCQDYHNLVGFTTYMHAHACVTCGGGWSAGAEFRAVFYFIF